jgi:hypothetical protein
MKEQTKRQLTHQERLKPSIDTLENIDKNLAELSNFPVNKAYPSIDVSGININSNENKTVN